MTKKPAWREYGEAIFIAFILAMLIRAFVVEAYHIPSGSMLNTLLVGDRILVNKFTYGLRIPFTTKTIVKFSEPKVDEIIVFVYPENRKLNFIKRIVGKPGDTIEMRNKVFYRNGEQVNEPYVRHIFKNYDPERDDFPKTVIPEGKYFMLGDNRDDSRDSRYWGFIDRSDIIGKAWRVYWSWGNNPGDSGTSGYKDEGARWNRIGNLVE